MNTLHIPSWLYFLFAGIMVLALMYHWQHVLTYTPFIFILLCPLMHVFHDHGIHRHKTKHKEHLHH